MWAGDSGDGVSSSLLLLRLLRLRCVERDGGADQGLQGCLVDLLALFDVDGATRIALEAGIEQLRRILERSAFCEGQLHHGFVGLAGADDAVMLPDRNAAPLPFLDNFRIGFLDQSADAAQRLAAPVAELLDARIDLLGGRSAILGFALRHWFSSCT